MNSTSQRIDLSVIQADTSLSLHKLLKHRIVLDTLLGIASVIDLEHVYQSGEAEAALKRCYLTVPYLLDKFGNHYKQTIMGTATSGKLKGMKYINAKANEYVHPTDGGFDIVVTGKCAELEGEKTRQIHLTCRPQKPEATPETAMEMA